MTATRETTAERTDAAIPVPSLFIAGAANPVVLAFTRTDRASGMIYGPLPSGDD
ncbi:hypothetical protein [Mycobacterium leprae]|uniref:hypothetical protein n=1 Tax=Mycobacterium leprae TaxID=1769 RepID=UPI0002E6E8FD|nr:hypothetical protein [Mycobacterium leprae]